VQAEPPSLHYYCAVVLHSCIVLPSVGHSLNHEYYCCQLTWQSSDVSNFYLTFKVSICLSFVFLPRINYCLNAPGQNKLYEILWACLKMFLCQQRAPHREYTPCIGRETWMKRRSRRRLEDNIKMGLKDTGCGAWNGFVWLKTVAEELPVCEELRSVDSVSRNNNSAVAITLQLYLLCNSPNKRRYLHTKH
jgi:hypothetical protein